MTSRSLTRPVAIGGTVLLAGCLLITACSGSRASSASSASAMHRAAAAPERPPVNAASGGGAGRGSAVETARLLPTSQSIIYTAIITIRAKYVATTAQRAIGIVVAAGGYTADEHAVFGPNGKTGGMVSLTLKIPVPSYLTVLAQLSSPALGKQLSMQQQATDVTQQVANVNSLVTSQQAAISALQGLLKKAASVTGLLQVQQQISQDEATLNSLLAQQRALDHETTFATVTMTLVSPHQAVKHKKPARRGFLAGLTAGWHALRHATAWLLTALGAILPFLIVAIVLAGLGWEGRRRMLRRRAKPTPAS